MDGIHLRSYEYMVLMKTSVDPEQLASDEASCSGSTLFSHEHILLKKICLKCAHQVKYAFIFHQNKSKKNVFSCEMALIKNCI